MVRAGEQVDQEGLVEQLVHLGYRREYQVEHRGEVAVRGSIVDVFPSTADQPVRIDLWGDEVDRLSEFSVADQRSTGRPHRGPALRLPGAAAHRRGAGAGDRAAGQGALGPGAVGPAGRGPDLRRDGVLAAVAGGRRAAAGRPAARRRPDAAGRARPHAGPGRRPAGRGDRPGHHAGPDLGGGGPHVPPAPPRLRPPAAPHRRPGLVADPGARGPVVARGQGLGLGPGHRRRHGPGQAARRTCWPTTTAWSSPPTATAAPTAWSRCWPSTTSCWPGTPRAATRCPRPGPASPRWPRWSGASSSPAPSWRCSPSGTSPAAAGPTAPPGPASATPGASSTTSPRATTSSTTSTASPATAAWSGGPSPATSGTTCVLEYRSGDRLYVPSDQIDAVRHYTGGDSPSLSRLNGSDWQKTKARVRSAVAEIAQELVVLYQKRITSPGTVFGPDTPWQEELEAAFPYRETPDQLSGHRGGEGRHGGRGPDGPPGLRRRRLRQDRGGHPGGVQGRAGGHAGRRPRARRRCWPSSTARPSPTASPRTRSGSRCSAASSPPASRSR